MRSLGVVQSQLAGEEFIILLQNQNRATLVRRKPNLLFEPLCGSERKRPVRTLLPRQAREKDVVYTAADVILDLKLQRQNHRKPIRSTSQFVLHRVKRSRSKEIQIAAFQNSPRHTLEIIRKLRVVQWKGRPIPVDYAPQIVRG